MGDMATKQAAVVALFMALFIPSLIAQDGVGTNNNNPVLKDSEKEKKKSFNFSASCVWKCTNGRCVTPPACNFTVDAYTLWEAQSKARNMARFKLSTQASASYGAGRIDGQVSLKLTGSW